MPDKTQKERILELLQERKDRGAFVYEFMMPRPQGLGIAQYNARIKELREQGYDIENVTPGHFVLRESKTSEPTPVKEIFEYFINKAQPIEEAKPQEPQLGLF